MGNGHCQDGSPAAIDAQFRKPISVQNRATNKFASNPTGIARPIERFRAHILSDCVLLLKPGSLDKVLMSKAATLFE